MNINDDAIRSAMSRHPAGKNRKPLRLTERGENLLFATYEAFIIAALIAGIVAVLALISGIEGN